MKITFPLSGSCCVFLLQVFLGVPAFEAKAETVLAGSFNSDEVLRHANGTPATLIAAGPGGLVEDRRARIGLDGSRLVIPGTEAAGRFSSSQGTMPGSWVAGPGFSSGIEPLADETSLVAKYLAARISHYPEGGDALMDYASGSLPGGPISLAVVPEPGALLLVVVSGGLLFLRRLRRPPPAPPA